MSRIAQSCSSLLPLPSVPVCLPINAPFRGISSSGDTASPVHCTKAIPNTVTQDNKNAFLPLYLSARTLVSNIMSQHQSR